MMTHGLDIPTMLKSMRNEDASENSPCIHPGLWEWDHSCHFPEFVKLFSLKLVAYIAKSCSRPHSSYAQAECRQHSEGVSVFEPLRSVCWAPPFASLWFLVLPSLRAQRLSLCFLPRTFVIRLGGLPFSEWVFLNHFPLIKTNPSCAVRLLNQHWFSIWGEWVWRQRSRVCPEGGVYVSGLTQTCSQVSVTQKQSKCALSRKREEREFDSKCKQFTPLKASMLNLFELINLSDGGKGRGENDIYV